MAKRWGKPGLKRASGASVGKIAVKVYVCRGCEVAQPPGRKPDQCLHCGRLDFACFDSRAEAKRYATLRLLENTGVISDLQTQVRFALMAHNEKLPGAVRVGHYVADFVYMRDGERVIEDVKGAITDVASWKLRHMAAQGLPVKITT